VNLEAYIKFVLFARAHPEIYDRLVSFLRRLKDKGWTHYSVKTCWDVLRFNIAIEHGPDDTYKLNDLYQSFYARLIFALCPDLRGFYEMREKQVLGPNDLSTAEVFRRLNQDFATGYLPDEPVVFPVTVPYDDDPTAGEDCF